MSQTKVEIVYTPMMQQYMEIKANHQDAIVFFRLGDFYEMFFDDAILASKVLEIALTSRDAGNRVPMAGIPHHAASAYIKKLIEKGFKVAIAEQVSEPGNGLVEREVVRIVTPGTVLEDGFLEANKNNFLASLLLLEGGYAVSYIDISTGESYLTYGLSKTEAVDLLFRLDAKEIVLQSNYDLQLIKTFDERGKSISFSNNKDIINNRLTANLTTEQKRSASHLLSYLNETQKQPLVHLTPFIIELKENYMRVDHRVKKHLEITESLSNNPKTTLLYFLDKTQTAMGGRRLKYFLNHPLLDQESLENRYNYIDAFRPYRYQKDLTEQLKYVYDINRIVSRVAFNAANPRDLWQLKETLKRIPKIKEVLSLFEADKIDELNKEINSHLELTAYLEEALVDNPPLAIKEGGIIRTGFNSQLDDLRSIRENGTTWLNEFELQERERTGIRNLKIGYNRIFGYFIEVSKANMNLVTDAFGYERKQTLANSERYITKSLKEKESVLLTAKDRSLELEYDLFITIRQQTSKAIDSLQKLALIIAEIDVYLSQAIISEENSYVRPKISQDRSVKVIQARHPVVEHFSTFVKNDVLMKESEIFLITGPNMSGKSTYMRMFALIVYLAQVGFFVPADYAEIPLYDAIYTRIGSSDDLAGGKSTFMVEMVESNDALTNATKNSLILFDEIGRGTATYDGMALAHGMIEYVHEVIRAQMLFSTHYHELTTLESSLSNLTNMHVRAKETEREMIFLHQVEKGASDKSYGLQVAALANLPEALLKRSKQILNGLERRETNLDVNLFNYQEDTVEVHFTNTKLEEVASELQELNLSELTPIEALLLLKHFQDKLKGDKDE